MDGQDIQALEKGLLSAFPLFLGCQTPCAWVFVAVKTGLAARSTWFASFSRGALEVARSAWAA